MRNPWLSFSGWAALFLLLAWPILGGFPTSLTAFPNPNDAQLIVWILDWVWYALTHAPALLYDAPIGHPAPAQLTGSDWFFSTQLVFGPLHSLTGNPLLAANWSAWLTYPLAAFCMERLLRRLGIDSLAALVGGLFFALASRRAPFNIHILQNANFLFPLLGIALLELRAHPDLRRGLLAFAAFALAILSALYGAFFSGLVGAAFLLFALACPGPGRGRFLGWALAAVGLAGVVALGALYPWLARVGGEARPLAVSELSFGSLLPSILGATKRDAMSPANWLPLLAILPAAFGAWRSAEARRLLLLGLALWLVAAFFAPGFPANLETWLQTTPLAFVAYPLRFQVIADLGRAIVLAGGLSALLGAGLPRPVGGVAVVGAAAVVLLTRGILFSTGLFLVPPALSTNTLLYGKVAEITATAGGPLLELPLRVPFAADDRAGSATAPDAMLGQMRHRQPLLNAYTGYHPPHRRFLLDAVGRLPSAVAIDDLLRATGMRWVLLRPLADWRLNQPPRAVVRAALVDSPRALKAYEIEGWTLVELGAAPAGKDWADAIRKSDGAQDRTGLGVDVSDLIAEGTAGGVTVTWLPEAPPAEPAFVRILVAVENRGTATWPASIPPERAVMLDMGTDRLRGPYQEGLLQRPTPFPVEGEVVVTVRWRSRRPRATEPATLVVPIPRDVPGGESVDFWTLLWQPERPGRYDLEMRLAQIRDGAPVDLGIEGFSQLVRIRR
ncbi:MAG: hypothetical protein ABGY42_02195 [bacterium]